MSRKNNLLKFQSVTSGAMSSDITSEVTNIQFLDNIAIQANWTGNPTGTITPQVSVDYAQDNNENVQDAGNWIDLPLAAIVAGSPSSALLDLNQLSAPWIRLKWSNQFIESGSITTVADSAGSLNSKYFLLNGADGTNWYIWYDNGSGVDPAPVGRSPIHVIYANNDSANTLATLTGTAMAAITSITGISVLSNVISFSQIQAGGHGSLAAGPAPTGFALSYTSNTGVLNAFISGKML